MSRPDHSFAHTPCASTQRMMVLSLGLEGSLKRGRLVREIANLVRQRSGQCVFSFCPQLSITMDAPCENSLLWFPFSGHAVLPSRGALVVLRTVCVPVAIKRCVEQVAKSVSRSTLLLVKLPRGCPFHSGMYAWCPGHASSQLDWCQPPMSIARCWALLPQQSFLQWALLSLGGMWESLEFSFCFVL